MQLHSDRGPAKAPHGIDFDLWGGQGHDDDCLDVVLAGGEGYALGMVPRGAGDDASVQLLRRGADDLVVGAAKLEGEDGLEVFSLCDLYVCMYAWL